MSTPKLSLAQVNSMSHDEFVGAIGPLFEGPPWIAEAVWARRPYANTSELYAALCDVMYTATTAQQEELIRAHPDLVGRAALARTLGRESTREQAAAELPTLRAMASADLHNLVFQRDYRIIPAILN